MAGVAHVYWSSPANPGTPGTSAPPPPVENSGVTVPVRVALVPAAAVASGTVTVISVSETTSGSVPVRAGAPDVPFGVKSTASR